MGGPAPFAGVPLLGKESHAIPCSSVLEQWVGLLGQIGQLGLSPWEIVMLLGLGGPAPLSGVPLLGLGIQ